MRKSTKTQAEEKFAATQKKVVQTLNEKEKKQQEKREFTANLRAFRLAKEEATKKAAANAAASNENPPHLPTVNCANPSGATEPNIGSSGKWGQCVRLGSFTEMGDVGGTRLLCTSKRKSRDASCAHGP